MKCDRLPAIIEYSARLAGQTVSRQRIGEIGEQLAAESDDSPASILVQKAWAAAGLEGAPHSLASPEVHDCPYLAWHGEKGWFVVLSQHADGSWHGHDAGSKSISLESLDGAQCVSLPVKSATEHSSPRAAQLIWQAVWARKAIYAEALIATFLVNTLVLSTSLYSMQVYDRVIPNKGFSTLWVLSTGVILAILLELLLKHVRGQATDRAAVAIDSELSQWFFRRAMGIRLDCRPQSVGTLAAEIKGVEMVRGMMSSTSVFILGDVPFALFFIGVIFMVGGMMALIPLILLPVSIIAGSIFQQQIYRHTKTNQSQSNKKTGLLVESMDGAESLKANGAEWKLQARWKHLVSEAGESDFSIRHYSSLSQHMTVSLQQIGYVALVAFGAWLVTKNSLTMGGVLACSIISGRALSPIAQLPGIMVQWAHARAAAAGLDRLISLPNEIDDRANGLNPGALDRGVRFEQVRFSYGMAHGSALEVGKLDIRAGERIGVIGAVGSGKSTFLKLVSGLYRPARGKVFLGGIDMAEISPNVLREAIAYLPQDIRLISGTLRDNLLQGLPDPGDDALLAVARRTGLIDLVANHPKGLNLPITEGGRGISGGQRQLIGLSRMLLCEPSLLLLDEPTASMDASTERRLVSTLEAFSASGITLLISTHKSALLSIVDRLLVIQNGRVAADGPRDKVLEWLAAIPQPAPEPQSA